MSWRRYWAVWRCYLELTWLPEDGQTSKPRQAASLIQHLHRPLQFPRFQWPAGKSSCLPALIPAPHREKQPCLCWQHRRRRKGENAGKGRAHLESIGERWIPRKDCRAGRNHSEEPRVRTWLWRKGGGRHRYSILKHKTRAPLGVLFLTQAAKCLSPVTFSLPPACRGYGQNSVQKRGDEMHTAPAEANGTHLWLECQDSVTQQQYYIKLLSRCAAEEICDWLGTCSRTAIWWFKKHRFLPTVTFHSSNPISCYSFIPRGVFHFQGSLHYVSWKAEVLERNRGSRRSNSPVQQPGTKSDHSCSDILPQVGHGKHCYFGTWPQPNEK